MTPTESKRIYQAACRSKRLDIVQEEYVRWHRVLRGYEAKDVEAALDAWWADSTPTLSGRVRGAFMPEPAELKPLIESARDKRLRDKSEPQDWLYWECGNHHRASSFIARSKPTPAEHPCSCGATLKCVERKTA